jgi:polyhydroxyalkanoate synthesis regulator phasin
LCYLFFSLVVKPYSFFRQFLLALAIALVVFLSFRDVNTASATSQNPDKQPFFLAQSDTAVRSEITSLRSRIARLEREISALRGRSPSPTPAPSPDGNSPAQTVNGVSVGETDPMFQRLANLAIELKERVNKLETRVAQIEDEEGRRTGAGGRS